jgi:hypothetical protein
MNEIFVTAGDEIIKMQIGAVHGAQIQNIQKGGFWW